MIHCWSEMLQCVNFFCKCEVMEVKMYQSLVETLANIFGCCLGEIPTSYLGLVKKPMRAL